MQWSIQLHRPNFLKEDLCSHDEQTINRIQKLEIHNQSGREQFFAGLVTIGRNYPHQIKAGRAQPALPCEPALPRLIGELKALTKKLLARSGQRFEWTLPVRELRFDTTNFQQKDMVLLAQAIESGHLSQLRHLDLRNNPHLNRYCMERFVRAVESGRLASLETLDLRDTDLSDGCINSLFDAISSGHLPLLTRLDIGGWQPAFSADSAKRFAAAIRSGNLSRLQAVEFSRNGLRPHDTFDIMNALADQPLPLAWLDLSDNRLTDCEYQGSDDTVTRALNTIADPTLTLAQLAFSDNRLTNREYQGSDDPGILALCRAIENGNLQQLRLLDLRGSRISPLVSLLDQALQPKKLPQLRILCLGNDPAFTGPPGGTGGDLDVYQKRAVALKQKTRNAYGINNPTGLHILEMDDVVLSAPEEEKFMEIVSSGRLATLRHLNFSGVGGCQALKFFSSCQFSMRRLAQALSEGQVHQLQTLNLSRNSISNFQLRPLLAVAPVCFQNLGTLILDGNYFDRESVELLANAIALNHFPKLTTLSVINCDACLSWKRLRKVRYRGEIIISDGRGTDM